MDCLDFDRSERSIAPDGNRVPVYLHHRPALNKLVDYWVQMFRHDITYRDVASRGSGGNRKTARFNSIRNNTGLHTVKSLHPVDLNLRGTRPPDACTHTVEMMRKGDHLGFARCILDGSSPNGKAGRHHQVFCTGVAWVVKIEVCASETVRADFVRCVHLGDRRTHRLKSADVDVHWPGTKLASAGTRRLYVS